MKKIWIPVFVVAVIGSLVFFGIKGKSVKPINSPASSPASQKSATANTDINLAAYFEIYTKGTERTFTDERYQNKSADVYIEKPGSPNMIRVKKPGITWADFFETLPMRLSRDCLITGTKQTFCSGKDGNLKFYLNSEEDANALDREIKTNDKLKVEFK